PGRRARHARARRGGDRRPRAAPERGPSACGATTAEGARLRAALADARYGLRVRRRRSVLTALGIVLATAMLAAALVVSDSLGHGFARGARAADLPDIIVRFDPQSQARVTQRISALPDVDGFSLRQEFTNVDIGAGAHASGRASVEVVSGRRGYAI